MKRGIEKKLYFSILLILLVCFQTSWQLETDPSFPQLLTNDFNIGYFSVKRGHRLRIEDKKKSIQVQHSFTCLRNCLKDFCTSVNIQAKRNGIRVCEMITSKISQSEVDKRLAKDSNFDFYSLQVPIFSNCHEIQQNKGTTNGVYSISPSPSHPLQVYCDMVTSGGGWTVIQKRIDGSVDFYRNWTDYKRGFGNKLGEYWLGLDNIHRMTSQRSYRLRVDMEDFEGNTRYAEYGLFRVADESDNYRLTVGQYSGNAGDSLAVHNNMSFSTRDDDNDQYASQSCALLYKGAWWYNDCLECNPNGYYYSGCNHSCPAFKGIYWGHWHGSTYSMRRIEMKIKPN